MAKFLVKSGRDGNGKPADIKFLGGALSVGEITEVYDDGTYTYICYAGTGSLLTDNVWVIKRIDNATGSSRWSPINQVATDVATVAALSYT